MSSSHESIRHLFGRLADPQDVRAARAVSLLVLLAEALLCMLIVARVPYTEIDWEAYMEEVGGFLGGELDYRRLQGGTGPLVYPAGFVWIYSGLHWLTGGGDVAPAQAVFVLLYLATQAVVLEVYARARAVPPWALGLLCLSKRLHSIFVLRLFNDCFAMLLAYAGVLALQARRVTPAILLLSGGVSVKMNVLLMAPPVLALCILASAPGPLLGAVALGAALQLLLAAPFLAAHPWSYLSRAFELSRVFQHQWTVNLKFLAPAAFASKRVAAALLALHVLLLALWWSRRWFARAGGPGAALTAFLRRQPGTAPPPPACGDRRWPYWCALVVFTGNFLGIATARTLHYQFYSWYFHTLPLLLWAAAIPTPARLAILAAVEWAFNVFPATPVSSAVLTGCHTILIAALWAAPLPAAAAVDGDKGQYKRS